MVPTPATHTGDLRTFLIDPPSGSRNWPKPLGTDKNLSLDQASELSSDPKARKDLRDRKDPRARLEPQVRLEQRVRRDWCGREPGAVRPRMR